MDILTLVKETLNGGDPIILSWPLVDTYWLPFACTIAYVFIVKRLGPAIMENRKPFDLRKPMIVYNFFLVSVYSAALSVLAITFFTTDAYKYICSEMEVIRNHYTYYCAMACWLIYVVKYLEYMDTIFFVLRKKSHLITNLHVIHHAALPVLGWVVIRSERSAFLLIPGVINSVIHFIMYIYYALAAMGPEVRKMLWWKEYLTRLQMIQFVLMLLTAAIFPISGCKSTKHGIFLLLVFATLFLALFYNFYRRTYKSQINGCSPGKANGVHKSNGVCHKEE